jgi:hypothetical protein
MNPRKNYLSVNVTKTPAMVELMKKLGSKNKSESLAAGEAIASVVQTPVLNNILQAPVISNLFEFGDTITEQDIPSIPLSDYFDVRQPNFLNVWTAVQAGGLASNRVGAASDLYLDLYDLWSAVHFSKKWARAGRTASVANSLTRLSQEILLKRNTNAATVLLGSLAGARIDGTSSTAAANLQVFRSNAADFFGMDELNAMIIKYHAICASWVGGTPQGVRASLTDLLGSPAWMGMMRGISYNPQNIRVPTAGAGAATYLASSAIAAPESIRAAAWSAAGTTNFMGIDLHEYNEFGIYTAGSYAGTFNNAFGTAAGSTAFAGYAGSGTASFAPTTEELVIGLNSSIPDLIGLRRSDNPSQWSLSADDQFTNRDDFAGFYGSLTEGFASIDNRSKIGLVW